MLSSVKPINAPKPLSMLQPEPPKPVSAYAKPVSAYDVVNNRIVPILRDKKSVMSTENPINRGSVVLDGDGQPIGVATTDSDQDGFLVVDRQGSFLMASGTMPSCYRQY